LATYRFEMSGRALCLLLIIALLDQSHLNAFGPARPVRSIEWLGLIFAIRDLDIA